MRSLNVTQRVAFEIEFGDLSRAIGNAKDRGIQLRNFFDEVTVQPSVFGWIPAASIYFNEPDRHLLEFVAKLPGEPRPEIGIASLEEWNSAVGQTLPNGQGRVDEWRKNRRLRQRIRRRMTDDHLKVAAT